LLKKSIMIKIRKRKKAKKGDEKNDERKRIYT
jgi:hypothetical protein